MNKKQYIFPSLTVVEIDADSLMQVVGSNLPEEELEDLGEEEEMTSRLRSGGLFDWR